MFQVNRSVNDAWRFWSEHDDSDGALTERSALARKFSSEDGFRVVDMETLTVVEPGPDTASFYLQRQDGKGKWVIEGAEITDEKQAKQVLADSQKKDPKSKLRLVDFQHLTTVDADPVVEEPALNPAPEAVVVSDGIDT